MKVKNVYKTITKDPPIVDINTSIEDVVKFFVEHPISRSVYVCKEDNYLVGIISAYFTMKSTLVLKCENVEKKVPIGDMIRLASARVAADIMISPPLYVEEDEYIGNALSIMVSERIFELPVLDKNGRVIGDLNFLEIMKRLWEV